MKQIPLTQGKFAIVDDEDYERVAKFKWFALRQGRKQKTWAAVRNVTVGSNKKRLEYMHRFILSAPAGKVVDHQKHLENFVDNRRANLRITNQLKNCWNLRKTVSQTSSVFKGVCWHRIASKWEAYICPHRKKIYIGLFKEEIMAAKAYDDAAKKLFGEFAQTNF